MTALLGVRSGTAQRWIDGYSRGGRDYPPIVRPERTGDELVTWGEFVEARFLAGYRRLDVPIQRMRPVVERLREQLGTPYPLAHAKLYAADRELVRVIQDEEGVEEALQIVVMRSGQTMLAELARAGDPPELIAEMYGITVDQVLTAERFERRRAA